MNSQLSLPRVDGGGEVTIDVGDSWDTILRRSGDYAGLIGKTTCVIDLNYRAADFSNALKDKDGHHLKGYDLVYINASAPPGCDGIAEEFAAHRGKRLADNDDPSELEMYQAWIAKKFGIAGAEANAEWNHQRGLRKAVNLRTPSNRKR